MLKRSLTMRRLQLLAALVSFSFAGTAAGETHAPAAPSAAGEVTQLLLLDGYRASTPTLHASSASAARPPSAIGDSAARPPSATSESDETLTEVVQRMWSQVRAYRRPGGAEVLLRGSF